MPISNFPNDSDGSNSENDFDDLDIDEKLEISIARLDRKSDIERIRRKEDNALKLVETVFDNKTRLILFSMIRKRRFIALEGAISTGKEANVYYASTDKFAIAIKIFRIDAPSFRKMRPYIEGDNRFKRVRGSRSGFIEMWAKKEFKNLKRMYNNNIPVPKPVYVERNIILMEFLGVDNAVMPLLKDCIPNKPDNLYKRIMESVRTMYRDAKLVHADLSEYNILYNTAEDVYFFIDVSQSVLTDHPRANEFLLRDLFNMNKFFKSGKSKTIELSKLFKWITGFEADEVLVLKYNDKLNY